MYRSRSALLGLGVGVALLATTLVGCSEESPAAPAPDSAPEVAAADLSGVEIDVRREPG